MNCYPAHGPATRRATRQARIGHVAIGGGAPIVVQSMTNTDTADLQATVEQVAALARAGSEIVRVTVNNAEAAAQVPRIRERLDRTGRLSMKGCTRRDFWYGERGFTNNSIVLNASS